MSGLKRILIAAFAPASQRWALVDGNPRAPGRAIARARVPRRGRRAGTPAFWRVAPRH